MTHGRQLTLGPAIAVAHAEDPPTARMAAGVMEESGARLSHAEAVLEVVVAHPGAVACELAALLPYDVVEVRRRLTDLANARPQQAFRSGKRLCRPALGHDHNVPQMRWYAAGDER